MISLTAKAETTIARPIDDVWAFVGNPINQDQWVDGMSNSSLVDEGEIGVGTRLQGVYSFEGRTSPLLITITEYVPQRRLGIESEDGPFPFSGLFTLQPAGDDTAVTNQMTAGSDSRFTSVFFTVFRPVAGWLFRRQLQKELGQLKAILEGAS